MVLLFHRQFGNPQKLLGEVYLFAFHRSDSKRWKFFFFCFAFRVVEIEKSFHYFCLLQFGNLGSLEQHGFARNRLWSLDNDPSPLPPANNQSSVDLILKSTEEDLKTWPRRYALEGCDHCIKHVLSWTLLLLIWSPFNLLLVFSEGLNCDFASLLALESSLWSHEWEIRIAGNSLLRLHCVTTYPYQI